jgi:hypothetical protein
MKNLSFIGFYHPQGAGRTLHYKKCKALFDLYIPTNWHRFPFIILIARGNHSHYPPPPTKLSSTIADEIMELIKEQDLLSLTPRM